MAHLDDFDVLCFDVYGTLIDWETGITTALQPLFTQANQKPLPPRAELLHAVHELEAQQQSHAPSMRYRDVLAAVHPRLAARFHLAPPSVWRLDRGVARAFAATNAGPLEGVPFDVVVTAEDVGSFKPAGRNFDFMVGEVREKLGLGKDRILQTAQSQFHDHHPAKKAGIRSCWIVRPGAIMGNRQQDIYDWKFDTLADMADAVEAEQA
ncbi:hypothetical protein BBAD15_g10681 [Beauveria bassiana D1-5]|uniref:(S)-2-haloacid dehalogenase 4A n=1 Tax=Beauveria bassiana D1-5 TaxID=1245745 RepID=A0A0A2V983_BEABA|nr:hypothetical protein BBAD15_g10681 [Beauveria bassiana D1-5]